MITAYVLLSLFFLLACVAIGLLFVAIFAAVLGLW